MRGEDGRIVAAGDFVPVIEQLGFIRAHRPLRPRDRRSSEIDGASRHPPRLQHLRPDRGRSAWLRALIAHAADRPRSRSRVCRRDHRDGGAARYRGIRPLRRRAARCSAAASRSTISAPASPRCAICRALAVDTVKIDGSFVRNLRGSADNQVFLRHLARPRQRLRPQHRCRMRRDRRGGGDPAPRGRRFPAGLLFRPADARSAVAPAAARPPRRRAAIRRQRAASWRRSVDIRRPASRARRQLSAVEQRDLSARLRLVRAEPAICCCSAFDLLSQLGAARASAGRGFARLVVRRRLVAALAGRRARTSSSSARRAPGSACPSPRTGRTGRVRRTRPAGSCASAPGCARRTTSRARDSAAPATACCRRRSPMSWRRKLIGSRFCPFCSSSTMIWVSTERVMSSPVLAS